MKTRAAFWDSSAIIPLCVLQDASTSARRAARVFSKRIVWSGTKVEINSSFFRLVRMGTVDPKNLRTAVKQWQKFQNSSLEVKMFDSITSLAVGMPEQYSLRALDSFQIAAALVWCKEKPKNRPFVCADDRLSKAASEAGFDVVSLL